MAWRQARLTGCPDEAVFQRFGHQGQPVGGAGVHRQVSRSPGTDVG
ncbi:hypothetical protein ACFRMQ_00575 [Kitasatospora sp. NPDC056783]